MVKLPSYFFILLSSVLVAASVIPFAGLKKELDSFAPVAREPNYPLNLAKREASGRKARHVRPDYGAMGEKPRHERPDYGAMDEKPRHERPDYGAMNEKPRHERPDYGAMDEKPRHERPDYGAMDEKPRHERPDYGAMNEKRGITLPDNEQTKKSPDGEIPNPYVFSLSERSTREVSPGGWIKIQDSTRNFKESWAATAYVHVEPNGLRELHWHADEEWLYVISGKGEAAAFVGGSSSRTFELQAGDSAVFPSSYGHYIKNLSPTEPLIFIEVFNAERYVDFSATQRLALTPSQTAADLLKITPDRANALVKEKQRLIA